VFLPLEDNLSRTRNRAVALYNALDPDQMTADSYLAAVDKYSGQVPNVADLDIRSQLALQAAQQEGQRITPRQAEYIAGRDPGFFDAAIPAFRNTMAAGEKFFRMPFQSSEDIHEEYVKDLSKADADSGLTARQRIVDEWGDIQPWAVAGEIAGSTAAYALPAVATGGIAAAEGLGLAGAAGVGALTNVVEGIPFNIGEAYDQYGNIDYSRVGTSTAIDTAAGVIGGGIGYGLSKATGRLGKLRDASRNLDAATTEIEESVADQGNLIFKDLQEMDAANKVAAQEQQAVEAAERSQIAEVIGRSHGKEELQYLDSDTYRAGRSELVDEVGNITKDNPELGRRVAKTLDEQIPPSEYSRLGRYRAVSKELVKLEEEASSGIRGKQLKEVQETIEMRRSELKELEKAGVKETTKKVGGVYDYVLKNLEDEAAAAKLAKSKEKLPVMETTVSERFPVLGKFLKELEQVKTGKMKRAGMTAVEQPSKDFYISRRVDEIGQGASEGLKNKLGKEFDRLNTLRNELYGKLSRANNADKIDEYANQLMDLERKLYKTAETKAAVGVDTRPKVKTTPEGYVESSGKKMHVTTEAMEKVPDTAGKPNLEKVKGLEGTPSTKNKAATYDEAVAKNPYVAKKIEGITDEAYAKYAKENIHKYDLNDRDVFTKVRKDFQAEQRMVKSNEQFAKEMRTNKTFRDRIRKIKDEKYKKFISDNLKRYNLKDPNVFSKMRADYKPADKAIINNPTYAKALDKGDKKVVDKAIKEVKEAKAANTKESKNRPEKRCK